MGEDTVARFRERARKCREIAAEVRTDDWRQALLTLAQDLDDEADKIEAEEAGN